MAAAGQVAAAMVLRGALADHRQVGRPVVEASDGGVHRRWAREWAARRRL